MNNASNSSTDDAKGIHEDLRRQDYHWRVVGQSVIGSSHEKAGLPCQDAHRWAILPSGVMVAAVADGAGSAAMAEVGSTTAVSAAVDTVRAAEHLPDTSTNDQEWTEFLTSALVATLVSIETAAARDDAKPSDLATTLILAIVTPEMAAIAQVGDGVAVGCNEKGEIVPLTFPQSGEFINETYFLTSQGAMDDREILVWRGRLSRIALMSDGLQMIALKMPGREPYPGFFVPLFDFVADTKNCDEAQQQLVSFLESPRVRERTDDDLTLLLAALVKEAT